MNDIHGVIGKLLPIGVIAGLVALFYLFDIFSVRPDLDTAPAKPAVMSAPRPAPGGADVRPPPTAQAPNNVAAPPAPRAGAVLNPPPAEVATESSITEGDSRPSDAIPTQPSAPHYVPPGGDPRQPLATDRNDGQVGMQLPNHEIPDANGAEVEAESQQLIDQPESIDAPDMAAPVNSEDGKGDGG